MAKKKKKQKTVISNGTRRIISNRHYTRARVWRARKTEIAQKEAEGLSTEQTTVEISCGPQWRSWKFFFGWRKRREFPVW